MTQSNEVLPAEAARFWTQVHRHRPDACWTWLGRDDGKGYGHFYLRSRRRQVGSHRIAYELLVGPIPEGLELDHLCRNPACVNPAHLEPVTMRENQLRGDSLTVRNAGKTHCPYGHPYDEENTYRRGGGGRRCRRCSIRATMAWAKRQQQERTHCPKGHALSEHARIDAMGRRRCGKCDRDNAMRRTTRPLGQPGSNGPTTSR